MAAAVGAVELADSEQRSWFEAICSAYDQANRDDESDDWEALSSTLKSALRATGRPAATIDRFVKELDDQSSPTQTVCAMAEAGPDALVTSYREMLAGNAGASGAVNQRVAYDPDAWDEFLATNGPRWNGTAQAWQPFVTWFLYEAGQQRLSVPAKSFLDFVESRPDKIEAFAQYGVTVGAAAEQTVVPDTSTFPDLSVGATGEWVAYLEELLDRAGF